MSGRRIKLDSLANLVHQDFLNLMDSDGTPKDDVKVPDTDIGKEIQAVYSDGKDLMVTIISAMARSKRAVTLARSDEEQAISWKEAPQEKRVIASKVDYIQPTFVIGQRFHTFIPCIMLCSRDKPFCAEANLCFALLARWSSSWMSSLQGKVQEAMTVTFCYWNSRCLTGLCGARI